MVMRTWKLHTIRRIFGQTAAEVTQHRTPAILIMKLKPSKKVFWMCKHRFFGPNFKMNDRVVPFLVHEYFLSILVLSAGISLTPEVFWSRCTDESPVGTPTFLVERLVKPCFQPTFPSPTKPFEPRTWQRRP